ncbi:MAG: hypothetical protein SGI86_16125, partial [Deltaproteobacteria bacterium]|nr:hypothetical protein [Deltaproteobacteria bacterium]
MHSNPLNPRILAALAVALAMGDSRTARPAEVPTETATVTVDPAKRAQTIEGFGVNFNGVYYRDAQKTLLELLVKNLGISIVRFDPYDQTDWEMENDNADPHLINWKVFDDRFSSPAFGQRPPPLHAQETFLRATTTVPICSTRSGARGLG